MNSWKYSDLKGWANDNNIYYRTVSLNDGLWGFIYKTNRNNYHIIIDKNLTKELQQKIFCHEVQHIKNDMPDKSWFIGMDMNYNYIERRADQGAVDLVAEMSAIFL